MREPARVPQPMGGRLAQPLGRALVRFACRLQVVDRVVEHLFDESDARHPRVSVRWVPPIGNSSGVVFTAIGEGSQSP
jgi:hypothetical protein